MKKKEIEKARIEAEKNMTNRLHQIVDNNKELIALKESIKKKDLTDEKLRSILFDLESYFTNAHMPSLTLYSGKYAGEPLELLFEHYPEIFSRDRYLRKSREKFRAMLGSAYEVVMAKLKVGDARPNQVVEFLKYIQPFLAREEDTEDRTSKLLFSVKVGDEKK